VNNAVETFPALKNTIILAVDSGTKLITQKVLSLVNNIDTHIKKEPILIINDQMGKLQCMEASRSKKYIYGNELGKMAYLQNRLKYKKAYRKIVQILRVPIFTESVIMISLT